MDGRVFYRKKGSTRIEYLSPDIGKTCQSGFPGGIIEHIRVFVVQDPFGIQRPQIICIIQTVH